MLLMPYSCDNRAHKRHAIGVLGLLGLHADHVVQQRARARAGPDAAGGATPAGQHGAQPMDRWHAVGVDGVENRFGVPRREIGRASCRERV